MADISKIKLPSGSTYDIVDKKSGYKVVSINRKVDSGVNIADITIGDTTTQLYAPQGGGAGTITKVKTTAGAHTAIDVSSGAVNFNVPTKTSHLTNDSGFVTTDEKVKNTKITPSSTPATYYISGSQSSSTATEELVKSDIAAISVVNQNNHTAVALALGVNSNDTQGSITLNGYNGKSTVVQPNASASSYPTTITLPSTTGTVALTSDIPTKTSDLTNDSGFITTETDPTVPSWAKASTKPTYTASEVGAVPTSRTVNGKALSSNISLTASDVGALSTETDPIFAASAAAGITSTNISDWNNKLSGSSVKTNSYMIIGDWRVQWGSVSLNTSSASGSGSFTAPYYSDKNITFSPAFAAIPYMYATIQGTWTGSRFVLCHNTSTTGSAIRLLSSHKNSSDVTIRWLAIGRDS